MADLPLDRTPAWSVAASVLGLGLFGLLAAGVLSEASALALLAAAALLAASVFAAVHHAEILALRIGEPLGSILLALAVTVIEVALIVSFMLSGSPGAEAVARDTVFAAVMIVLNGVVGLCLVLGGRRHHEQRFRLEGASAALAVLGTLAVVALVLPNHTVATLGPTYSPVQLAVAASASLVLYITFVFAQTVRHRDYFLDEATSDDETTPARITPGRRIVAFSAVLLPASLAAVVLLAKTLSHPLESGIASAGLPHAVVGVVVAAIVLLPEGLAAAKAAIGNRVQGSLNLALGSALASIGLTIPAVAAVSLFLDTSPVLGLSAENTVLLILTLFVSTLTLGTGRTTALQGVVHLVIFAVFLLLTLVP
ncbi:calcium:proton antiporter [Falsiroseomonas sp. CW058]|uniref:calcium:proton antiporter n=1 Tax=Falsiroseomonas sp. CW058 TaxID=3388664 RepID=UPI003D31F3B3